MQPAATRQQKKWLVLSGYGGTAFGIVKCRTDGKRLLVYTNSGVARLKEAYAYHIGDDGMPIPQRVVHV